MRTKLWGPDNNKLQGGKRRDLRDPGVGVKSLGQQDNLPLMDIVIGPGQLVAVDPGTTQSPDTETDLVDRAGAEISIVRGRDLVLQLGDREASQKTVLSTDDE